VCVQKSVECGVDQYSKDPRISGFGTLHEAESKPSRSRFRICSIIGNVVGTIHCQTLSCIKWRWIKVKPDQKGKHCM
jgi:hypothetical protein